MHKLLSIFSLALLYFTIAFGQAAIDYPIMITDNAGHGFPLYFGLDLTATDGIDVAIGEAELPGWTFGFDARLLLPPLYTIALNSYNDYRNAPSFPFTGQKEHRLAYQVGDGGGTVINIEWNLPSGVTGLLQDIITGTLINVVMSGTGTYTVTNPGSFPQLKMLIDYDNVAPIVPAPVFAIAPLFHNFGSVFVGSSANTTATISNTGDGDLVVQQPAPVGAFSVTGLFPITILEGGAPVDVTITFAPTSEGAQSGDLVFAHNAAGSPYLFHVTGTGAGTAPIFRVVPASLNFGLVTPLTSEDMIVTVYNDGLVDPLIISSATIAAAEFVVNPTTSNIPAGGNQVFTVTFTPPAVGTYNGTLVFAHNAAGSPDEVSLLGYGYVPPAEFGLIFDSDTVYQLEDASYMEIIQLKDVTPTEIIKAIQFRLYTNQAVDDNTILTFQSITKGSNVADPSWILETNVVRGPINSNGASEDLIYVLLYNINQGPGWAIGSGDWNDMFHVTYRIADLPALTDSVKSSIRIANEEASSFEGFPIDITGSRDDLTVIAKNRVGGFGDVNGDGCLDILDLILVVDHIVGRDSLVGAMFQRADIAPWVPGNALPDPDGFVNVQDLSLIQNIILTGVFPDGTEINDCSSGLPKSNGTADALVKFYINPEGITAVLTSTVAIRGAQIEFNNVTGNPENMVINTDLGQGYYSHIGEILKTLLYDRLAIKYIEAGEHFMADMPFVISNPEEITLRNLILIDTDRNKLGYIEVELIYGTTPLPLDYILFQNYPNPFNPSTSVKFQVPKTSDVTVKIYDMLGQEVRTLFASEVMRGTYSVEWDGMNDAGMRMSSGSYIYRMIAGDFVQSKKMLLLK